MLLLKPYSWLIKTGKNKYRLHMVITVPDDFELDEPVQSKGADAQTLVLDYPLISLPGQMHETSKEYMKTLKNVQEGDRIIVQISTEEDAEDLYWIDDPFLFDDIDGPRILGKTVLCTTGVEEEDDNRGEPISKTLMSDPEED